MDREQFSKNNFWIVLDFITEHNGSRPIIEELSYYKRFFTNSEWIEDAKYIEYSSGGGFIGKMNASGGRSGIGMSVSSNNRIYIGEWSNDEYHGEGFYYCAPGIYWGNWSNGLQEGKGHMWTSGGYESEGQYRNGIEISNMYRRTPNGGYKRNDIPNKQPQITFRNNTPTQPSYSQRSASSGTSNGCFEKILLWIFIISAILFFTFISNYSSSTSEKENISETTKVEQTKNTPKISNKTKNKPDKGKFILSNKGVGCIKFNMRYDQIPAQCDNLYTHFEKIEIEDGMDGAVAEYNFYDKNMLVMTHTQYSDDKISDLEIFTPKVTTANGLYVGQFVKELLNRKFSIPRYSILGFIVDGCLIKINSLSESGSKKFNDYYLGKLDKYKIAPEDFTENAMITSITYGPDEPY